MVLTDMYHTCQLLTYKEYRSCCTGWHAADSPQASTLTVLCLVATVCLLPVGMSYYVGECRRLNGATRK